MKKRALISVYDKEGIDEFAKSLSKMGWEIISTGNTAKAIEEAGVDTIPVEDITNFPEILDGRVKTLSPYIFGGILYKRCDESHIEIIKEKEIKSIDMVVVSLYPFVETVKRDAPEEEIIEEIDIGGPSMIRAAAKNYRDLIVVTDKKQYDGIIDALENEKNDLSFRKNLAREAFSLTASYDMAIADYFDKENNDLRLFYKNGKKLRYGENPHQEGYYFEEPYSNKGFQAVTQLQGKELSFNNYVDAGFGMEAIREFKDRPTAIAIKHANPCGVASADSITEAYAKCYEADTESIFGGIIVLNREVDETLAHAMSSVFLEIIIAPKFSKKALTIFGAKKNLRLLEMPSLLEKEDGFQIQSVPGGLLVQDKDDKLVNKEEIVTKREPSNDEKADLDFAWRVAKIIKSNGIVIAKNEQTLGLGIGDVNRFFAMETALNQAGEKAKGAVCGSDGFFPFGDSAKALAQKGVTAIIQPGGSMRDYETIEMCDENNITMIMTGMRHFRH